MWGASRGVGVDQTRHQRVEGPLAEDPPDFRGLPRISPARPEPPKPQPAGQRLADSPGAQIRSELTDVMTWLWEARVSGIAGCALLLVAAYYVDAARKLPWSFAVITGIGV